MADVRESSQTVDPSLTYTVRLDYDIQNNTTHVGCALPGSSTASAIWRIQNMVYDGNNNLISVLWADGDLKFDNIWDNHLFLSYS